MSEETEAARNSELDNRFLLFYIDRNLYSMELHYVLEIIAVQKVTRLPNLPDYIRGILNLRGKVIPVIDMRLKIGLPERPYDDKTCIIVLDLANAHIGLIVDSVSEVVTIPPQDMADAPAGNVMEKYVRSVSSHQDGTVLNIDCEKLFANDIESIAGQA